VPDESQDAVTSIFLFHELPPKVRRTVFRECARVLKPGGRWSYAASTAEMGDKSSAGVTFPVHSPRSAPDTNPGKVLVKVSKTY
jgi:ubiquinone/menaquinone biosynthesis C-methylase UbiE